MSEIELSGIFSCGYGIIPKNLMRMKLDDKVGKQKGKNIKLVLSYMLSYTGGGSECFPSIETISEDLEIGRDTVIEAISNAVKLKLISKSKMFPNDPIKNNNKYKLSFLESLPSDIHIHPSRLTTSDGSTLQVDTFDTNNNSINNNSINNNSINNNMNNITLNKQNDKKEINDRLDTNDDKLNFYDERIKIAWVAWRDFKWKQFKFKYKNLKSEQDVIDDFKDKCNGNYDNAMKIVKISKDAGYKGLFELYNTHNLDNNKDINIDSKWI